MKCLSIRRCPMRRKHFQWRKLKKRTDWFPTFLGSSTVASSGIAIFLYRSYACTRSVDYSWNYFNGSGNFFMAIIILLCYSSMEHKDRNECPCPLKSNTRCCLPCCLKNGALIYPVKFTLSFSNEKYRISRFWVWYQSSPNQHMSEYQSHFV